MIDREKTSLGIREMLMRDTWRDIDVDRPRYQRVLNNAIALLKEQEAVSAHWDDDTGHWIEGDRNGIDTHTRTTGEMIDTFRCSWCGFYQYWKTPYCPNCGAKMERLVK